MVTLALLMVSSAHAQAVSVALPVGVVAEDDVGLRPGVRVGFEPVPEASLDLQVDSSFEGYWDTGLSLTGRLWLGGYDDGGVYGLGRMTAGFAGDDRGVGPWTGLAIGFGGRPVPALDIAAAAGPEWTMMGGPRWRTELTIGVVIDRGTFKGKPGVGSVYHHPRKPD